MENKMTKEQVDRIKWLALIVLCLGTLMDVLDTTIVNVALPSIRESLHFSPTSLAWVVNAYMLTFGGFLLLAGKLGDLYGQRKLFLIGTALFTLASLGSGIAQNQLFLIGARALQGLGAAVITAIGLSLVISLFPDPNERAKAMGIFGFVAAGGGSLGVLLGGVLTGAFNWHWIFLVNLPIGILVFVLCLWLLPRGDQKTDIKLDIWGAILITTALILAVYAIINGNIAGWTSNQTLGLLGIAVVLLLAFLWLENRIRHPLMPLSLFRRRNLQIANVAGILWSAGMFAWFFLTALYLQLILHFTPLKVGLAFLPSNVIMAIFSLWLSAKMVMKYGIRASLTVGLSFVALGLLLLARIPVNGKFVVDILPSMIFLGLGAGISFNPMLLAAMSDVSEEESGLASGLVNTAFMMGGALGLAILASLAAYRTEKLLDLGQAVALTGGYHAAFLLGAILAGLGAAATGIFLRIPKSSSTNINH